MNELTKINIKWAQFLITIVQENFVNFPQASCYDNVTLFSGQCLAHTATGIS